MILKYHDSAPVKKIDMAKMYYYNVAYVRENPIEGLQGYHGTREHGLKIIGNKETKGK